MKYARVSQQANSGNQCGEMSVQPSRSQKRELAGFLHLPALPHCSANHPPGAIILVWYARYLEMDRFAQLACGWGQPPSQSLALPSFLLLIPHCGWVLGSSVAVDILANTSPLGLRPVDYHNSSVCLEEEMLSEEKKLLSPYSLIPLLREVLSNHSSGLCPFVLSTSFCMVLFCTDSMW